MQHDFAQVIDARKSLRKELMRANHANIDAVRDKNSRED